jgi:hypothetical protein
MKKRSIALICFFTICASMGSNLQFLAKGSVLPDANHFSPQPTCCFYQTGYSDPPGVSPQLIRTAYDLPSTGGQGTIAIIDAYDDPTILDDTNVFCTQYGLPNLTDVNFEKHMMSSHIDNANLDWMEEMSLDVQWAHAIAPSAKILLIEMAAKNLTEVLLAVDYARNRSDVVAISMSWGWPEQAGPFSYKLSNGTYVNVPFANESLYDSYFTSPYNATFFAASGDNAQNVSWPAVSPNVVGVGGTTLTLNANGSVASETVWDSYNYPPEATGGGVSSYEVEPSYQVSYGVQGSNGYRGVPDVSYAANPVYGNSLNYSVYVDGGWTAVWGTSAGAPQWAAIRSLGSTASNDRFYAIAKSLSCPSCFRDITNGTNRTYFNQNSYYNATSGYDFVTGLGSPLTTAFGAWMNSFNVYLNDATQNLTTLDCGNNGLNYDANINFTWNETGTNNVYLRIYVYDANGSWAWSGSKTYDYLGPGTQNVPVSLGEWWPEAGTGTLQVTLSDGTGAINYMAPVNETVNIVNSNHPPNAPSFISYTLSGHAGDNYSYTANATDPDGDNIQYIFNWGDGTANTTTAWTASGLPGTAYHSWASPGDYYVTATVYDPYGLWNSSTLGPVTIASSSGSCPFVSTWNGTGYVLDNNILPQSETSNGTDVTDYYTLEQTLAPMDGQYELMLSEFEHEQSLIDYAQLVAVDHRANVNVGVSPTGQILTYTHPYPAVSAITNEGKNVTQLLSQVDGNYYEGYNGSYVTLNFGRLDVSQGAKLVIVSDLIIIKCPIYIQTMDDHGNWRTVATIYTRNYWATDVIDLKNYLPETRGRLMVRLAFVHNDTVDFVGLDTSPQATIDIHPGQLVSAFSSADGDVTANLLYADKLYAEMVPGENIQLKFNLQEQTMQARTYIFIAEGHYYTITP